MPVSTERMPPKWKSLTALALSVSLLSGCHSLLPDTAPPTPEPTPTAVPNAKPTEKPMVDKLTQEELKAKFDTMSPEEKVGQLVFVSIEVTDLDNSTAAWLTDNKIGNVILFAKNADSAQQVAVLNMELQSTIRSATQGIPAFIGVDQEGGMVSRIREGVTIFPSSMAISAGRQETIYSLGWAMAEELLEMGININFAPDMDVNSNPKNPVINIRSYGEDPQIVAELGSTWLKAQQECGVVSVVKHFPGHGDTAVDSHFDLPKVTKTRSQLEELELIPFRRAIETGVSAVMTSHILFPKLETESVPATMSKTIITDLLKTELGFNGLVISDGLQMEAIREHYGMAEGAVKAVQAGVDMLILGDGKVLVQDSEDRQTPVIAALNQAVSDGTLSMERLDDAVWSILKIKNDYGLFTDPADTYQAPYEDMLETHAMLVQEVSDQSMTLIRDDKELLPLAGDDTMYISFPSVYPLEFGKKSFGEVMADHLGGKAFNIHQEPTQSEMDDLLQRSANFETAVVLVYNLESHPSQKTLIEKLLKTDIDVIAVCAGSPYDVLELNNVLTILCSYGYTPSAVLSLVSVLNGTLIPEGKLPVTLK